MAETTVLRDNMISRNASVGATPPHGPVKTGELPLVQHRATPGSPQVREVQQQTVTILPPRDEDSAYKTGGLPMVKVKMINGKPQKDDGLKENVVIRNAPHGSVTAGALPMVQVERNKNGYQVQTLPNVQGGPPQLAAPAPAMSSPRGPYVARVAAPVAAPVRQVELPPVPEMSMDQLMLFRHLADKYLGDLQVTEATAEVSTETISENVKFVEATIETIDQSLVATAVRLEAVAKAAAAAAAAATAAAVATPVRGPVVQPVHRVSASQSVAPAPSASYVAGRVGGANGYAVARTQRNAGMAPRRVARQGAPLPMVQVEMNSGRAVVQNQDEVAAARAQALNPTEMAEAPEVMSVPVSEAPSDLPQG